MYDKSSKSKALKSLGVSVDHYEQENRSVYLPITIRVKKVDGKPVVIGECDKPTGCLPNGKVDVPSMYTKRDVFAEKVSEAIKAIWDKL
jgi:hypothetical protein